MSEQVAVLMYHDVLGEGPGKDYAVSAQRFGRDLDAMSGEGLLRCEVTFDDGWLGTYLNALPALQARKATATLFVTTGFLGRKQFMDEAMVREWHRAGQRIGSHAVTHHPLTMLPEPAVRQELADSKARLEDLLGAPVDEFAVPGGNDDAHLRELAFQAGYRRIHTSRPGFSAVGADVIRRFIIRPSTPEHAVRTLRSGREAGMFWRDRAQYLAKHALGIRLYFALRGLVRPMRNPAWDE